MADIELVIKIPEEMYKDIQSRDWKNGERWFSEEWKAIHKGTPLPKGRGRLIDGDRLIDSLVDGYESINWDKVDARDLIEEIESAPTIIEPYKAEGSEDKE